MKCAALQDIVCVYIYIFILPNKQNRLLSFPFLGFVYLGQNSGSGVDFSYNYTLLITSTLLPFFPVIIGYADLKLLEPQREKLPLWITTYFRYEWNAFSMNQQWFHHCWKVSQPPAYICGSSCLSRKQDVQLHHSLRWLILMVREELRFLSGTEVMET